MSNAPLRLVEDAASSDPEGDYIAANLATGRWSPEADRIPSSAFEYHARTVAFIERHTAASGSPPSLAETARRYPTLDTDAAAADTGWVADQMRRHHYVARVRSKMVEVADAVVAGDAESLAEGLTELAGISPPTRRGVHGLALTDVVERPDVSGDPAPTHSDALNEALMGGMRPGQFVLVAARLSVGKTFWMLNAALSAARAGKKVCYYTLEMTPDECLHRLQTMILHEHGVDPSSLDAAAHAAALDEAGAGGMRITVSGLAHIRPTPEALEAAAADNDVLIIDYMGLMRSDDNTPGVDDWKVAASIATRVQQLAKRHSTVVLSAAQLNRDGRNILRRNSEGSYDPTPGVDKISQTDVLGQSADIVIMLERLAENVTGCWMAKNRNGRAGMVWYSDFDPAASSFADIREATALLRIEEDETRRTT